MILKELIEAEIFMRGLKRKKNFRVKYLQIQNSSVSSMRNESAFKRWLCKVRPAEPHPISQPITWMKTCGKRNKFNHKKKPVALKCHKRLSIKNRLLKNHPNSSMHLAAPNKIHAYKLVTINQYKKEYCQKSDNDND